MTQEQQHDDSPIRYTIHDLYPDEQELSDLNDALEILNETID